MIRNLEVCAADINSVLAAKEGGAQRVELCTGLSEGGTTPSDGLIEAAVATGLPVHVLIRPRSGNFIYTPAEKEVIRRDIVQAIELGASGVVVGALTQGGELDTEVVEMAHEIKLAAGKPEVHITFHRAFDCCNDPLDALNKLMDLKVDYLLTSGQAASAIEGVELLSELVKRAEGRIKIIAAAGINSSNAAEIARKTGCPELHASARVVRPVENGNPLFPPFFPTDAAEVKKIVNALKSI